jgi:acyl dehydratase
MELSSMPRLGPAYRTVAFDAVRRRRRPAAVPDVGLTLAAAEIDIDHLAAYDRACGYRLADRLPPTYPHVLAFPLAMTLMTRPDFPFPLPGLVHVANRIETIAPLRVTDRPELRVRATALAPHPRGRQVELVTEAYLDGACAWREHSTYLHRDGGGPADGGATGGGGGSAARDGSDPRDGGGAAGRSEGRATPPAGGTAVWRVPASVGRRYAAVSGDRNPIHTSRLGARLFGFRRRIAHGMWTAARCLAALEGRLPDAARIEVRFRRPLLLPGTATFTAAPGGGNGWTLTLADQRTGRTHLTGTVN